MNLMTKAKELFTRRGGTGAAKEDAQEVKDVAQSDASVTDKGKEGFEAVKDPGAPGEAGGGGQASAPGEAGGEGRPSAGDQPAEQRGEEPRP
jgi:hypothetical protein